MKRRPGYVGDTGAVRIGAIRLQRLRVPLDPPFPAAWDPVPRTLVRGDDRPRRDRRGHRRHRLGRHDGRVRGVRAPLRRSGSARDRSARPSPRDDRLPRRSVLAARGGPVGHRGPGRGAAGRHAVRRRDRRAAGVRLLRDAAARTRTGRSPRCGCARRASAPSRSASTRAGSRKGWPRSQRRVPPSATRWRSWST